MILEIKVHQQVIHFESKLEHFVGQGKLRVEYLAVGLFVRVTGQLFQFGRFKNLSRRKMFLKIKKLYS